MNIVKWAIICLAVWGTSNAFAQLEWENHKLEFHPALQETNVVAHFRFKNISDNPITVLSVKSSCGCTIAQAEKKACGPGEKSEVVVTFTFGQRVGLQEKTILVETDDSQNKTELLTLSVHIPQLLKIEPSFVYWKRGEEQTPKTIKVTVNDDTLVHIVKIQSSNKQLTTKLEEIKTGKEYVIHVTPLDTQTPAWAILNIETDAPSNRWKVFTTYAQIR